MNIDSQGTSFLAGRNWKRAATFLGLVFAGMQLVPPTWETSIRAENSLPRRISEVVDSRVAPVLERSCGDCHSNETVWPWYSHVAPVSWILSNHVGRGREKLNFSNWGSEKHTANQLAEVCDAVSDGSMPLRGYSVLHPSARLSQEDVKLICEWSRNSVAQVTSAKQQASARTGAR